MIKSTIRDVHSMHRPTLESIHDHINQLHTTKSHAVKKTMLLFTELQENLTKDEDAINQFSNKIHKQMRNTTNQDPLVRIYYDMLILIAHHYPRNHLENGQPVCPITRQNIDSDNVFTSVDRYHWSAVDLIQHIQQKASYIHPLTNNLFTYNDMVTIWTIAQHKNIELPQSLTPFTMDTTQFGCLPNLRFFRSFTCFSSRQNIEQAPQRRPHTPHTSDTHTDYPFDSADGWIYSSDFLFRHSNINH